MMLTLDSSFKRDLKEAALDDVQRELAGSRGNLIHQAIEQSHEALRDFSDQYPGVESVIDSLGPVEVERDDDSITVRWGWDHEAAPYFEYGTSDHHIDGDPILSFVWEDPPAWVRDEFEQEDGGYRVFFGEVDVTGIDETRFVRIGIEWLRLHLGDTIQR